MPEPQYLSEDLVRRVRAKGEVNFKGKSYYVGQAFSGQQIAFRPTQRDGYFELYFGWKNIGSLDLNDPVMAAQDRPRCALPKAPSGPGRPILFVPSAQAGLKAALRLPAQTKSETLQPLPTFFLYPSTEKHHLPFLNR